MALDLKPVGNGGVEYFKPAEHFKDAAILLEVQRYVPDHPSKFDPAGKPAIFAKATFFHTDQELDAGEPGRIVQSLVIRGTALVNDLEQLVGSAAVVTVDQLEGKDGKQGAYVFRNVPQAVLKKVVAYAEKREAELTEARTSGAIPDFLS